MTSLKELRTLKQEETTLVAIASKISDQLNRLKVEELALQSMLQMQQMAEQDHEVVMETDEVQVSEDREAKEQEDTEELVQLDLNVAPQFQQDEEEEEYDDEEETTVQDELTQFVTELGGKKSR